MHEPIYNLLGLAMRAGGVVTGDDACMAKIRSGKALLTVIASDIGSNARKKYHDKCQSFGVPIISLFSKDDLGRAVGKAERAVVVVVNKGFADRILQLSKEQFGGEVFE